jgi:hypothetical protein
MATVMPDAFRDGQMGKATGPLVIPVDFESDTIEGHLIDDTDLSAPAGPIAAGTFDSEADINQGTRVAGPVALVSKVVNTPGTFDAGDMTGANAFVSVTGDAADYLCLTKDNATEANAPLIVTFDSATTGLPVTPNGGDITVTWNASGILQI